MSKCYLGDETMQLVFDNNKCCQCYECLMACPSGALNIPFTDGYPTWDTGKCTKCESCQDICTEEAIKCQWE